MVVMLLLLLLSLLPLFWLIARAFRCVRPTACERESIIPSKAQLADIMQLAPPGAVLEYRSARSISKATCLFLDGKPRMEDVKQGVLGDCWLLSSVACVASHAPHELAACFIQASAEEGQYRVRLFKHIQGKVIAEEVTIDDSIPCLVNGSIVEPLGAQVVNGVLWPALLEKACAVSKGGYERLHGGLPSDALTVLLGHVGPVRSINLMELPGDWVVGRQALAVAVSNTFEGAPNRDGIDAQHAYALLRVYKRDSLTLVELQNPFGHTHWSGPWHATDSRWNMHPDVKADLYNSLSTPGVFIMPEDHFTGLFRSISQVQLGSADPCSEMAPETEFLVGINKEVHKALGMLDLEAGCSGRNGIKAVVISGASGAGKSKLGDCVFRSACQRFFYSGSLHGWCRVAAEPTDTDLSAALQELVDTSGLAMFAPASGTDEANLATVKGANRPLLLYLDGVPRVEALQKLLPVGDLGVPVLSLPPGSRLIVTTSNTDVMPWLQHLMGPERVVELRLLAKDPEEIAVLLQQHLPGFDDLPKRRAESVREVLLDISRKCGGNPKRANQLATELAGCWQPGVDDHSWAAMFKQWSELAAGIIQLDGWGSFLRAFRQLAHDDKIAFGAGFSATQQAFLDLVYLDPNNMWHGASWSLGLASACVADGIASLDKLQAAGLIVCEQGQVRVHRQLQVMARSTPLRATYPALKQLYPMTVMECDTGNAPLVQTCSGLTAEVIAAARIVAVHGNYSGMPAVLQEAAQLHALYVVQASRTGALLTSCTPVPYDNLRVLTLRNCGIEDFPCGFFKQTPRLVALNLSYNKELQDLSQSGLEDSAGLQVLNLNSCRKLRMLPVMLGSLVKLHTLKVSHCNSLQLPASIGTLAHLVELKLSGCGQQLQLPQGVGFSHLLRLELPSNMSITADVASGLPVLTSLVANQQDVFPLSWPAGALPQIKVIEVACEELDNSIKNLTSLQVLRCDNSGFSTLPTGFGDLQHLQVLSLRNCKIAQLPAALTCLTSLWDLDLSCSEFTSILRGINAQPLRRLQLWKCVGLTSTPKTLCSLQALTYLDVSDSTALGKLRGLSGLANLLELNLSRCSSLVELPESLGDLVGLTLLDIMHCSGLTTLPETVGKLRNLQVLHMSHTGITALPDSFTSLEALRILHFIAESIISDGGLRKLPDNFGALSSLATLVLRAHDSLAKLPASFSRLSRLQHLHIGGCCRLTAWLESRDWQDMRAGLLSLRVLRVDDDPATVDEAPGAALFY